MNLLIIDDVGRMTEEYLNLPLNALHAINKLEDSVPQQINIEIKMALNGFPPGRTIISWTSTELALEVVEEIIESNEPLGMVVSKGKVDKDRPLREFCFRRNTILPEYGPEHNRGILNVFWVDEDFDVLDEDTRDFAEIFISKIRELGQEPFLLRTKDFKIHEGTHGEFKIG